MKNMAELTKLAYSHIINNLHISQLKSYLASRKKIGQILELHKCLLYVPPEENSSYPSYYPVFSLESDNKPYYINFLLTHHPILLCFLLLLLQFPLVAFKLYQLLSSSYCFISFNCIFLPVGSFYRPAFHMLDGQGCFATHLQWKKYLHNLI